MDTRPFGADGRLKLRNALFAGAAVPGLPRALSFGVGSIAAAPKRIAVRMRRSARSSECSPVSGAGGRKRRVIEVAGAAAAVEGGRVALVIGPGAAHAFDQVRVGDEGAPERDHVGAA